MATKGTSGTWGNCKVQPKVACNIAPSRGYSGSGIASLHLTHDNCWCWICWLQRVEEMQDKFSSEMSLMFSFVACGCTLKLVSHHVAREIWCSIKRVTGCMLSLYCWMKALFVESAVEGDDGLDNANLGWVVKSSSLVIVGPGSSNTNTASSSKSSGICIDGLGRNSSW